MSFLETLLDYTDTAYVLIIFFIGAYLMFTRKLPALITLPLMAVFIVGGVMALGFVTNGPGKYISLDDIFDGVISKGAIRLSEAIIVAFFGGILSFIMQKSGVAESLVKHGAELIGDNPLAVGVFSIGLIALLFTSIGGLGAIIMVSMVILPMLATVGVPPIVAGGIMLIGISVGGILNAGNWVLYTSVLGIPIDQVKTFALTLFLLTALMGVVFVCVELYRAGTVRSFKQIGITLGISVGVAAVLGYILYISTGGEESDEVSWIKLFFLQIPVLGGLMTIVLFALLDLFTKIKRWRHSIPTIKWYSYLIPIVPLVLIIVFNMPILAAFLVGFIYAILVTARPGSMSMTVQSMIQGSSAVMPAVILMIGIGILVSAVLGPPGWSPPEAAETIEGFKWPVNMAIAPLFQRIPTDPIGYTIVFGLLAPLALYRGPLNIWGMGFGIATILVTGGLPAVAVMVMLLTVGQVQGICDPTNTHNVWLANELRVDVQKLMWRTLPYVWVLVFIGLAVAAFSGLIDWKQEGTTAEESEASVSKVEQVETLPPNLLSKVIYTGGNSNA